MTEQQQEESKRAERELAVIAEREGIPAEVVPEALACLRAALQGQSKAALGTFDEVQFFRALRTFRVAPMVESMRDAKPDGAA